MASGIAGAVALCPLGVVLLGAVQVGSVVGARQEAADWLADWEVAPGMSLEADAMGFTLPTAIAFVPDPGPGPKDPLYFVTEIRGKIKVVTNDRSVHTFAEGFFQSKPLHELPETEGETGMAGLCLDPSNGYVFVSYAYHDDYGNTWNDVSRFEATPGTFSLRGENEVKFTALLKRDVSDQSHQIGPMAIHDGALYLCVGDARQPLKTRDLGSTLGKVLRMSLDGEPLPDNPFYVDDDRANPRNFVWAYGLRNPFGITFVGERLFATDNGPGVDRFVEIEKGGDYKYDGTDWSIGSKSDVLFAPAVGPVQVTYMDAADTLFPEPLRSRFFVALSGFVGAKPGRGMKGEKSVISIPYDWERDEVAGAPQPFLRYRGRGIQLMVGVTRGPDALYVLPLMPTHGADTAVLKIRHEPTREHPWVIGRDEAGRALMVAKGCFGCHSLEGGDTGLPGPSLERDALVARLSKRLSSRAYLDSLDELDLIEAEPFVSFRDERELVRQADGRARLHTWLKFHVIQPKFDNPNSQMPSHDLTEDEASRVADALLALPRKISLIDKLKFELVALVPRPRLRHLGYSAALGFLACALFLGSLVLVKRLRGRS